MIGKIILGYVAGRWIYEKTLPTIFILIQTLIEGNKWFNKRPSKFDDII